jgi:hypothetical protein
LKPVFKCVADDDIVRKGVIAFRDFLNLFYDRLISDGDLHFKLQKNPKSMADYPFLNDFITLLIDMGYHGKMSDGGDSLLINEIPLFAASKPKVPGSRQIAAMRFLSLCGFVFSGIDLEAKSLNLSATRLPEATYPGNPGLLIGLKAMSIADTELRVERSQNDNIFMRCDYRVMKAEGTDAIDILTDLIHPLPVQIQNFALDLHRHYINAGMTCVTIISTFDVHLAYSFTKNSRRDLSARDIYYLRVWEFAISLRHGFCLVVRSRNTDKYADVVKNFHFSLRDKIAQGYGCDRKLRNERCQGGCQGIRIPLDESIYGIRQDVEMWLDKETETRRGGRA